MFSSRSFELVEILLLILLVGLIFGRVAMLRVRGVNAIAGGRSRSRTQVMVDVVLVLVVVVVVYEAVVFAIPFPGHLTPPILDSLLVDAAWVRLVGVVAQAGALAIYVLALRVLGESWRIGIDRETPGVLVTAGVFAWSRKPIYLSLNVFALGVFLVLGRVANLLPAVLGIAFFHLVILREERFLVATYGGAYQEYCARVGRYFTLRLAR